MKSITVLFADCRSLYSTDTKKSTMARFCDNNQYGVNKCYLRKLNIVPVLSQKVIHNSNHQNHLPPKKHVWQICGYWVMYGCIIWNIRQNKTCLGFIQMAVLIHKLCQLNRLHEKHYGFLSFLWIWTLIEVNLLIQITIPHHVFTTKRPSGSSMQEWLVIFADDCCRWRCEGTPFWDLAWTELEHKEFWR